MSAAEPTVSPQGHPRRAFGVGVVIAFGGPLVGAMIYGCAVAIAGLFVSRFNFGSGMDIWRNLLALVGLSFAVGFIPALASSIWLGWMSYRRGTFSYGQGVVAAILTSFVLPGLLFVLVGLVGGRGWQTGQEFLGIGAVMALIAVSASLIIRWLLRVMGVLPTGGRRSD